MTDPTVAEQVTRRADELIVGDRIDRKHLPVFDEDATVVFVRPYRELRAERWVFVAFEYASGYLDSTAFRPGAALFVTPAADPTGERFGREPDELVPAEDDTIVPRRRPPHYEDGRIPPTDPGDLPAPSSRVDAAMAAVQAWGASSPEDAARLLAARPELTDADVAAVLDALFPES